MLRQMRIRNFQSIEDVTYNFTDGLNVIVAPNNTGKSIINKIIELLVNFKSIRSDDVKQYITFGKPKSDIFISDEQNAYWVEIYPKKINYYKLENSSFIFIGNELPIGLINALSLLICEGNFVGNLITSNHSKLLVDSSADINNQILSLIARDDHAENILEECEERMSVMNSNLRTLRANRALLEKEISTIAVEDTTYREEALKRVFGLTEFVEELIGLNEATDNIKCSGKLVNKLDEILGLCSDIEMFNYKFDSLRPSKDVRDLSKEFRIAEELESFISKLNVISNNTKMITEIKEVTMNNDFLGLVSKLEILKSNLDKTVKYKPLNPSMLKACEEMSKLTEVFNDYSNKAKSLNQSKLELKKLKEEIDSYGGEVYDCPIYGTIKFVNEECIRYCD